MHTWHIHIEGQVQGVGFRPFVFVLAQQMKLNGWVNNTVDGVHIVFNAPTAAAHDFQQAILANAPQLSRITAIHKNKIQQKFFDNFQIIHSEAAGTAKLLLTPDFALCEDCRNEIKNPDNRRLGYAFTTCTNCGPRFSIVHALPYDREQTSMETFHMCEFCESEYQNPKDRRYYSQTNSCASCGIQMHLIDPAMDTVVSGSDIIDAVVALWRQGKIVAIKGIGGYLLTCDAQNEKAVNELR
ncbi:MAG: acylphosphatase, partial [Bacteroidota bacterium]